MVSVLYARFDFEPAIDRYVKQQAYLVDQKNNAPEQFRAIGWCGGLLCSVVFESPV
jgi:hypothetical protein